MNKEKIDAVAAMIIKNCTCENLEEVCGWNGISCDDFWEYLNFHDVVAEMSELLQDIATNYQCMPNPAEVEKRIEAVLAKARGEDAGPGRSGQRTSGRQTSSAPPAGPRTTMPVASGGCVWCACALGCEVGTEAFEAMPKDELIRRAKAARERAAARKTAPPIEKASARYGSGFKCAGHSPAKTTK